MLPEGIKVAAAVQYLRRLSQRVSARFPEESLHLDLAALRGYHYRTGVVFAAYQQGQGQETARGGRYDDIGVASGSATEMKCSLELKKNNNEWQVTSVA